MWSLCSKISSSSGCTFEFSQEKNYSQLLSFLFPYWKHSLPHSLSINHILPSLCQYHLTLTQFFIRGFSKDWSCLSLFTDPGCNVLCNLLAKAPFQTEMRVIRAKMSSLIPDIHCWHLSSVCHGWRRREMVFREPEIQESVTLKPLAECNVLMPGWNSWQFTWAMLKCSRALLGNKQRQTGIYRLYKWIPPAEPIVPPDRCTSHRLLPLALLYRLRDSSCLKIKQDFQAGF